MSRTPPRIEPAELSLDATGTPYSPRYDDVYHSAAGGLGQAEHVFLGGNDLPARWQRRRSFVILETGFGQGLNFLASWAAWRRDPEACGRLHFLSVEKHPFRRADLEILHRSYPELAELSAKLRAQWPELTSGFHRLEFDAGRVVLTLAFGDALALLPQFVATPDAIFLDGFAPARNPELWSPRLLSEIGLLAGPGTTLATWSTHPEVRAALIRSGFVVERRPGFGAKKRMLCGRLPAEADGTSNAAAAPSAQHAIVVGAGLAGALVAERLCARGWSVELFERQAGPAMETSSNLTAVMLPMLSLDDNRASRLNRACYLHALRTAARWRAEGLAIDGDFCGVLQLARDAAHRDKQQEILARCGFPESYVSYVDQASASRLAGANTSDGGWWFAGGAWWNPPSLCRAALTRAGERLRVHYATPIDSIAPCAAGWCVRDGSGRTLAEAPQLILANAHDLLRFPESAHLPLFRFRGQVSHFDATRGVAPLRCVVCKEGYVSPPYRGELCVGASFHRGGEAPLRDQDQRANLERLESMLPGYLAAADELPLRGKVGFRPVSPDKLPMLGELYRPEATPQGRDLSAVERWPGLHVATGYGARGLVWSFLMAELLASQLNGDPLPLEADLAATVDPARFLLRRKEA